MSDSLPTLADLSPTDCLNLDEKCAVKHFLGKTLNEAKKLFQENALYYAEDLMWMGDAGFVFYFPAYYDFFQSEQANEDVDALNQFISVIQFRVENRAESIKLVSVTVMTCLDYCLTNFSKFQVDIEIYGDLESRLLELKKNVSEL